MAVIDGKIIFIFFIDNLSSYRSFRSFIVVRLLAVESLLETLTTLCESKRPVPPSKKMDKNELTDHGNTPGWNHGIKNSVNWEKIKLI